VPDGDAQPVGALARSSTCSPDLDELLAEPPDA
jgi:hypothetical protein